MRELSRYHFRRKKYYGKNFSVFRRFNRFQPKSKKILLLIKFKHKYIYFIL